MKIAVCDDEEIARENIVKMINTYTNKIEIFPFSSGKEMLESGQDFDISFLDMGMENMSGMELARRIREKQEINGSRKSILIFVTAFREYMEEAFDVNAYHYLVKPIEKEKFIPILEKAIKDVVISEKYNKRYIIIKHQGVQKKLLIKDILYIESSNKKIIIHTTNNAVETYGKMEEMEREMKNTFFRCHRCYLVNMEKISAYNVDTIQLINGEKLILAQKKYTEFVKQFLRYAKDGGTVNV